MARQPRARARASSSGQLSFFDQLDRLKDAQRHLAETVQVGAEHATFLATAVERAEATAEQWQATAEQVREDAARAGGVSVDELAIELFARRLRIHIEGDDRQQPLRKLLAEFPDTLAGGGFELRHQESGFALVASIKLNPLRMVPILSCPNGYELGGDEEEIEVTNATRMEDLVSCFNRLVAKLPEEARTFEEAHARSQAEQTRYARELQDVEARNAAIQQDLQRVIAEIANGSGEGLTAGQANRDGAEGAQHLSTAEPPSAEATQVGLPASDAAQPPVIPPAAISTGFAFSGPIIRRVQPSKERENLDRAPAEPTDQAETAAPRRPAKRRLWPRRLPPHRRWKGHLRPRLRWRRSVRFEKGKTPQPRQRQSQKGR